MLIPWYGKLFANDKIKVDILKITIREMHSWKHTAPCIAENMTWENWLNLD